MKYRYERKYLVPNYQLDILRKRLMPFLVPDSFGDCGNGIPQYTVRSIYFDTPNFDSLLEKTEGLEVRKKLRVRAYNNQSENSEVFLEIKRKLGSRIGKNRALLKYSDLIQTLEYGEFNLLTQKDSQKHNDDAARFFLNLKRYAQRPVNLVVYEREPYHGKFNHEVRITFDKNIRASVFPEITELFDNQKLSPIWKEHFILEIKYFEGGMPSWVKSIITEFNLKHEALSKYASAFINKEISMYNVKMG
jgi:hypothetical protein